MEQTIIFGNLIKQWREAHGLSLYAISKSEGIRIEALQRIEQGQGGIDKLLKYLDYIALHDRAFFDTLLSRWYADKTKERQTKR